jgi:hypothetical protein
VARVVALVFAKPPRAGAAKTRLAASVGAEGAAAVARAMLRDAVEALTRPDLDLVLSTPAPDEDHGVEVERWDQGGGELGERLERTLARALERWPRAIALGADSPGLPTGHVDRLLAAEGDAVLAPTDDGGFWALRLDRFPPRMLVGVTWSAPTTAAETAARLQANGLRVGEGPGWWDVDQPADLDRVRRQIDRERARWTHAALDALGWPS